MIVDTESMDFKYIGNPNVNASGGAGIQTAQMVSDEGVEVVLTGNVGPNAYRVLESAGVKICTGASGTAEEAIRDYKDGKLSSVNSATVDEYFGMGGRGGGMGRGGGRGMGRGRGGGGMGRGGGMGGGRRW